MKRLPVGVLMVFGCAALVQGTDLSSTLETTAPAEVRWSETISNEQAATNPRITNRDNRPEDEEPRQTTPSESRSSTPRSVARQELIRQHQERIEKIIQANRATQHAAQRESTAKARKAYKPGAVIRVAEGLSPSEMTLLEQQLKQDGFTPGILHTGPDTFDVILHYGHKVGSATEQLEAAHKALAKLKELHYQFNTVRFGPLVQLIKTEAPEVTTNTAANSVN